MIEHFDVRRSLSVSRILGSDIIKLTDHVQLAQIAQGLKGSYYAVGISLAFYTRDVNGVVKQEAELSFEYDHLRLHLVSGVDLSVRAFDLTKLYSEIGIAVFDAKSQKGVHPVMSYEQVVASVERIKIGLEQLLKTYEQPVQNPA